MKRDSYLIDPPYDWQDRLVMRASIVTGLICIFLLVWGY